MTANNSDVDSFNALMSRLADVSDLNEAIHLLKQIAPFYRKEVSFLVTLRDKCHSIGLISIATKFAKEVVEIKPTSENFRVVSGLLEKQGQYKQAIPYAREAVLLSQDSPALYIHLGILCSLGGDFRAAKNVMVRALEFVPSDVDALHHAGYSSEMLGELDDAVRFATRIYEFDNSKLSYAIHAANLMIRQGKCLEGAEYLEAIIADGNRSSAIHRTCSGAFSQIGEYKRATEHAILATKLDPDVAEYQLHLSCVLFESAQYRGAYDAAKTALGLDPNNWAIKRHIVTVCLELGENTEAVAHVAELLKIHPDNEEYAQCMQHVLFQRADNSIGIGELLANKAQRGERNSFRAPTFWHSIVSYLRVIRATFLREIRAKFGETRLGYLWVLVEPMIHMVVLAVVFQFTMKGSPPLGNSFFFFYFTGLIPYQLFIHTCESVSATVAQNKPLLNLPPVTNLSTMYSRGLLELYTATLVILIFTVGFLFFSVNALPKNFYSVSGALMMTWLLALGVGMINAIVMSYFHAWHHIFQIIQRFLYFTSGIFYVPGAMDLHIREILWWNPLLHSVDWFRTGYFEMYQPPWLSIEFLGLSTAVALAAGLLLEASCRKSLRRTV